MKITVKNTGNKKSIKIRIPSFLFLNRITAWIAAKFFRKIRENITSKQLYILIKEIRRFKRRNKKLQLVEITEASREYIEIRL